MTRSLPKRGKFCGKKALHIQNRVIINMYYVISHNIVCFHIYYVKLIQQKGKDKGL